MGSKLKWYRFRLRTLLIVILLILSAPCYVGYRIYSAVRVLPMGSGPAGPLVSAVGFEGFGCVDAVLFVGLGEFITNGLGASERNNFFALLQ
jgi:hypothetical protein